MTITGRTAAMAAIIVIGVVSLFAVVTLQQDLAGTAAVDDPSLVAVGAWLVAVRDWTFLLGPGVMAAVNAMRLGTLMYRSGLVPRAIPLLGLIGAPSSSPPTSESCSASTTTSPSGRRSPLAPIFFWELSLGIYLVVKGFRTSPVIAGSLTRANSARRVDDVGMPPPPAASGGFPPPAAVTPDATGPSGLRART